MKAPRESNEDSGEIPVPSHGNKIIKIISIFYMIELLVFKFTLVS